MFPIRDHNPSRRTPYVTYALLAANILIFLSYAHLLNDDDALFYFFDTWGMTPGYIIDGRHWSTLITHMFLHGGWLHLAGNMLFLWIFGDNLEDQMGHGPYLLFYLLGGSGAAGGQMAADICMEPTGAGTHGQTVFDAERPRLVHEPRAVADQSIADSMQSP